MPTRTASPRRTTFGLVTSRDMLGKLNREIRRACRHKTGLRASLIHHDHREIRRVSLTHHDRRVNRRRACCRTMILRVTLILPGHRGIRRLACRRTTIRHGRNPHRGRRERSY